MMAFVNEVPSVEEITMFGLPYINDQKLPIERRRQWIVDRSRNFHFWGGGLTGNPAFEKNVNFLFYLHLNDAVFCVVLRRGNGSLVFTDDPYVIVWSAIVSIRVVRSDLNDTIALPKSIWLRPSESNSYLAGFSLNEFVSILKEALVEYKDGCSNRHIKTVVVVNFEF